MVQPKRVKMVEDSGSMTEPGEILEVGDLEYDPIAGVVRRDVDLVTGGLTLALFDALVGAAPAALDAGALARQVWQRDHVSDDTIAKRVSLLRQALGSDHYVQTMPDRSYRLAVPVARRTPDAQPAASGPSKAVRRFLMLSALASVMGAVVLIALAMQDDASPTPRIEAGEAAFEAPSQSAPARMVAPDGSVLEAPPSPPASETAE